LERCLIVMRTAANWEVYLDEVALDSNRIGCDR